jgi:hypothetical protein
VFAKFKKWLGLQRAKSADWKRAWSDAEVRRPDGRTNFQHVVLSAIEPLVGPVTLLDTTGDVGQYFTGLVPGTDLTLYLYVDEVQAHGKERRFLREKWDYDTPQAFADDFTDFVRDSLKSNNRFERSRGSSSMNQGAGR